MTPEEIDELIAVARAGGEVRIALGYGAPRTITLDDLETARAVAASLSAGLAEMEESVARMSARHVPYVGVDPRLRGTVFDPAWHRGPNG